MSKFSWLFYRAIRFSYKKTKRLLLGHPLYTRAPELPLLIDSCNYQRITFPQLTNYHVCNPSLLVTNTGDYVVTVRGCNYYITNIGNEFRMLDDKSFYFDTQNYLAHVSKDLHIDKFWFLEDRCVRQHSEALNGIEDIRLFKWNNEFWIIGSALKQKDMRVKTSTMIICQLDGYNLINHKFIQSPVGSEVEKNWMPLVINNDLHFIYQVSPLTVYQYVNNRLRLITLQPMPILSGYSGGSAVFTYKDKFIMVIHKKIFDEKIRVLCYEHRILVLNTDFSVYKLSNAFRFESIGIEFCSGIVIHDDYVIFSYGVIDSKAVLLKIIRNELNTFLDDEIF